MVMDLNTPERKKKQVRERFCNERCRSKEECSDRGGEKMGIDPVPRPALSLATVEVEEAVALGPRATRGPHRNAGFLLTRNEELMGAGI